jgi:F-type H+-transporting ATPase subunit b
MHEAGFFAEPRTWVAVAFIIFFILFGKKLWQAIAAMLDKRTEAVRAELAEAQRLRQEAEAMLTDARKRREAALAEARALLEGAKAEAARLAREAAEDAEAAARRRERMAMDRIAAAEKAAVDEVRMLAAEIATAAARDAIREGLTAEADARLIDHAIGNLTAALTPRRAA